MWMWNILGAQNLLAVSNFWWFEILYLILDINQIMRCIVAHISGRLNYICIYIICEYEMLWVLRTFGPLQCHISGGLKYIFNFIRCWVLQDHQLMVSNPIMKSIGARDLRPLAVSHFWCLKLYSYFYIMLSPWVFQNIELFTYGSLINYTINHSHTIHFTKACTPCLNNLEIKLLFV